jgi:hypothetical protein
MNIDPEILDWLLAGDPVIRWQVMHDLLQEPEAVWRSQQDRLPDYGWRAEFVRHQLPDGSRPNGRWPLEKRIAGITFFDMEKPGGDSRWNTLRALRVLRSRASRLSVGNLNCDASSSTEK